VTIDQPRPTSRRWAERLRHVRWGRLAALVLVALVLSVGYGVTTASVQLSLGPHEARYAVTTDRTVTVDLGPLGTLQLDSPLPLTLGVRVTVEEIPEAVSSVTPAVTLAALGTDLQGYVQFFTSPQTTIADVTSALILNAAARAGSAFVALLTLAGLARALLGHARRAELGAAFAHRRRRILGSAALVVVVVVSGVSSLGASEIPATGTASSSVFKGTPLEGARITGRLSGLIDTYGGEVLKAYRANETFYAGADRALVAAWKSRATSIRASEQASALLLIQPAPGQEPTFPAAGVTPSPAPDAEPPIVMLQISDLHCNVGMAPLIGSIVTLAHAAVVLDSGDSTINGTAVEQPCVTALARAVPSGVPIVVADGNHDSSETSAQEARAGMTVLSGKVVTVAGVRILGDDDPNQTRIGAGTTLSGLETAAEEGERLAQEACDAGDVDILMVHTPWVGDASMESGCVPVQLSGHLHQRVGPVQVGKGERYINASTAGAKLNELTVGPLRGVAEMTVLRFDPQTRHMIDYQVVRVRPDGSADVGLRLRFPAAVPTTTTDDDGSLDPSASPSSSPSSSTTPTS